MANPEHLKTLKESVRRWNEWRKQNSVTRPRLSGADLSGEDLRGANLVGADLGGANLGSADLGGANLGGAELRGANLVGADLVDAELPSAKLSGAKLGNAKLRSANLSEADLNGAHLNGANMLGAVLSDADLSAADLSGAELTGADLSGANLVGADLFSTALTGTALGGANLCRASLFSTRLISVGLSDAKLESVRLHYTLLSDVDLRGAQGIEDIEHVGPSIVDHRTLAKSGPLPEQFLRGCGLPDEIIHAIPALQGSSIQFYSCFISYSSRDDDFAKRLHADLQDSGVRCWFAPEDLKIGDRIRGVIHDSIRIYDKLLLVLSERSVKSKWVEEEVETALQKEHGSDRLVLFPVRLDGAVMESQRGWAETVRQRHIGDFSAWKDHDAYREAFDRLLRDLRASEKPPASE